MPELRRKQPALKLECGASPYLQDGASMSSFMSLRKRRLRLRNTHEQQEEWNTGAVTIRRRELTFSEGNVAMLEGPSDGLTYFTR